MFTSAQLQALIDRALAAGLAEPERRPLLLADLPADALRRHSRPDDQLKHDLRQLAVLPGSPPPLARWLRNAADLVGATHPEHAAWFAEQAAALLPDLPRPLPERLAQLDARLSHAAAHPTTAVTAPPSRSAPLLLAVCLVGASLGFIAGLSSQVGISEKLLNGVLIAAVASGLGYAFFRLRGAALDPTVFALGLAGFAVFVIGGVILGIQTRDRRWLAPEEVSRGVDVMKPDAGVLERAGVLGDPVSRENRGAIPCPESVCGDGRRKPKVEMVIPPPKLLAAEPQGTLRGCTPDDLDARAALWRADARRNPKKIQGECREWFEPQAGMLGACTIAELELSRDGAGDRRRAALFLDLALSLVPGSPHLQALKEELSR